MTKRPEHSLDGILDQISEYDPELGAYCTGALERGLEVSDLEIRLQEGVWAMIQMVFDDRVSALMDIKDRESVIDDALTPIAGRDEALHAYLRAGLRAGQPPATILSRLQRAEAILMGTYAANAPHRPTTRNPV